MNTSTNAIIYKSKTAAVVLLFILALRITSYFTLFPDSVVMTQIVKVSLRLFLTMLSCLWLFYLRHKYVQFRIEYQNMTPLLLYGCYLILGFISIFWSSSVGYSLLQLAMVLEALVFAWFYLQLVFFYNRLSGDHARFSWLFGYATFFILMGFVLGLFLAPDTFLRGTHGGVIARLGGFIINPNELGMLAVLGAVMAYIEMGASRVNIGQILLLVGSFCIVLLTQSRSSLGAFLLITCICILLSKNRYIILTSILAAVFAIPTLVQKVVIKEGDINEVLSLTGRLPFWEDLITYGFTKEPIWGYGFMRISYSDKFHSIHSYAGGMTHNTFIQVLLNLGLVGAFICLFQLIALGIVIGTSKDKYYSLLAWLMLIPLIINSTTEFGIFGESNYGVQFYQFVLMFFMFSIVEKQIYATKRQNNYFGNKSFD